MDADPRMDKLERQIGEVHTAICGSVDGTKPGLHQRQSSAELAIAKLQEAEANRMKWLWSILTTAGVAVATSIWALLTNGQTGK